MKIAILGGGISGLSTYLNLQKQLSDHADLANKIHITIFEAHDLTSDLKKGQNQDVPSSGGGYGLAANGLRSLKRLDPAIYETILRNGFPSPRMQMKAARGWTLGSIPNVVVKGGEAEACVMVLREVVLNALYQHLPKSDLVYGKVASVEDGRERATVTFQNGEKESFDLIIGADGVWSKTRKALLASNHDAEYRGLFTVGGFVSPEVFPTFPHNSRMPAPESQTVMIFGRNGFFAYTPCTTGDVPATSEHIGGDLALAPGQLGFWWSRSAQANPNAELDDVALKKELENRHQSWRDPTIREIFRASQITFKIPTWVLPKLPTWAGERVVLVGDAAHALPSSSGQGVSQALEDAEALATILIRNLSQAESARDEFTEPKVLEKSFSQYMTVRKAHVEKVLDIGNRSGDSSRDMNVVAEFVMYLFLYFIFKFYSTFMKDVTNYDLATEIHKVLN